MSTCFEKGAGWRYDLTLDGQRFTNGWYKTEAEARQAEAQRREEGNGVNDLNLDQRVKESSRGGQAALADFQLVSAEQLARLLGVPPVTIYSWKRRGKIPYLQLERCIRFDLTEIKGWLEQRKRTIDG